MKLWGSFATFPLMPRGSHFSCLAKKSDQKKATPTIVPGLRRGRLLSCDVQKKAERPELATLKQRAVLIAFFFRFSGLINGDPSSR